MSSTDEPDPLPHYVGVDDSALRKGQRYGTILIDLEGGRVIDIFEGRDGSALAAWLKAHPVVEVLTRDRWAAFAEAATEGAPQTRQVADHWHLLKNLREAVEQLLAGHATQVREALQEKPAVAVQGATPTGAPTDSTSSQPPANPPRHPGGAATSKKHARQANGQERVKRYEHVQELRAQGQSLRQMAWAMGLS